MFYFLSDIAIPLVMTHMANNRPMIVIKTMVPQMMSVIKIPVSKLTPPYFGGPIFGSRP